MVTAKHFFLIIPIIFLFLTQTYSIVICRNNRACPDNYSCSLDYKDFCCKDRKCDVRNSWSLLKSECLDETTQKCPDDEYCVNYGECVTKKILVCDTYSEIMDSTGSNSTYLDKGFIICNALFLLHNDDEGEVKQMYECAEKCFRTNISNYANSSNHANSSNYANISINLPENYLSDKFIECYTGCGMCLISGPYDEIFAFENKTEKMGVGEKFSTICHQKILDELEKGKVLLDVKNLAKIFIDGIHYYTKYNASQMFGDLMKMEDNSTIPTEFVYEDNLPKDYPSVLCQSDRACPKNYNCSLDYGNFCCQNDTCDMLSKWSLLQSQCPYDKTKKCPDDEYCRGDNTCLSKDAFICDDYIPIIESTKCAQKQLLGVFSICGSIHSKTLYFWKENADKEYSIHKCGESCFRHNISDYLLSQNQSKISSQNLNESSCDLMEKYITKKVTECYLDCGICFVPQIVSSIFYRMLEAGNDIKVEKTKVATTFSTHCNEEYLKELKKDGKKLPEIKRMAKEFIREIYGFEKYNATDTFKDLMEIEAGICKDNRGCPENYKCSVEDENFCCQNGTCDVKSRFSYLKSQCPNNTKNCLENEYCVRDGKCVTKEISICDNYLHPINLLKCSFSYVAQNLQLCGRIFSSFDNYYEKDANPIHKCTEQCLKPNITNYITNLNEKDSEKRCDLLRNYADQKYMDCYVECGICFDSSILSQFFNPGFLPQHEYRNRDVMEKFSLGCLNKYVNELKKGKKLAEIKDVAKEFVGKMDSDISYDASRVFENLMGLEKNSVAELMDSNSTSNL